MAILQVENLSKSFIRGEQELKAVDNISFQVKKGEVVLIMGPSGSGKTTLVSMVGALLTPTSGSIKLDNVNLFELSKNELARKRLKNIGFIFQSFNLLSSLKAVENIELVGILNKMDKGKSRQKAMSLLKKLGIEKRSNHYPRQLSGGEQQRVSIARALMNDPDIILADEPTGNLDSKSGKDVMTLLCSIACNQGKGVIIVTHDVRLNEIADRILWIEDGKIIKEEKVKRQGLKPGQMYDHVKI